MLNRLEYIKDSPGVPLHNPQYGHADGNLTFQALPITTARCAFKLKLPTYLLGPHARGEARLCKPCLSLAFTKRQTAAISSIKRSSKVASQCSVCFGVPANRMQKDIVLSEVHLWTCLFHRVQLYAIASIALLERNDMIHFYGIESHPT